LKASCRNTLWWLFRLIRHPVPAWSALSAYAGFIFYLSSGPIDFINTSAFPDFDKVLHITGYSVFGGLSAHALSTTPLGRTTAPRWDKIFLYAVVIGVLYGASDEFHQSFVPTRTAEIADLVADSIGVTIGAWSIIKIYRASQWSGGS
jgi:hypothetical protein